jgi:hypothetical protein
MKTFPFSEKEISLLSSGKLYCSVSEDILYFGFLFTFNGYNGTSMIHEIKDMFNS